MSILSIRDKEGQIGGLNFGLLPWKNLVTLIAPDYFGNPVTTNYWGVLNYHETIIYSGLAVTLSVLWCIFNWKKMKHERFFIVLVIVSLILCFNNPIAKLLYWLKIPFLSTSGAGRIAVLFSFSGSILVAKFLSEIRKEKIEKIIRWMILLSVLVIGIVVMTWGIKHFEMIDKPQNLEVALRNMILPILLLGAFGVVLLFRKSKLFYVMFCIVVLIDLFRWGWKYVPFVPKNMVFPNSQLINFLTKKQHTLSSVVLFFPNILILQYYFQKCHLLINSQ
jgi:hypothetical protein